MTAEAMQWVYEAVTMGSPLNHKFERCLLSILRSIQRQTNLIKSFFEMPGTKYIPELFTE
jgi:hypothetical protein